MKKLQIVRVDNDLVQKANLQIGNNLIGRGAATGCNDGQVLKHAVIINVSPNDEMTITAVAPCYMKSTGCTRWRALKLGTSVPIKPGDVCSLLPEKCWFKIISATNIMDENEEKSKRKADDLNNETDSKKTCLSSSIESTATHSEASNDISLNNKNSASNHQNSLIDGDTKHNHTNKQILQEIYSASSPEGDNILAICSKTSADSQNAIESSVVCESRGKRKTEDTNSMKETVTAEPQKKIKWDCNAHFSDQNEALSSCMADQPKSITAKSQNQTNIPNAEKVPREKCMYGARCYRKNPNHKKNCSHPGDPDYDKIDNRKECPYGVKCYRKNPQHKAQFKHTSMPRRRRRAATPLHPVINDTVFESDVSSMEESIDESDYEPSTYSESSEKTDWNDSESEWEDGTTG